MPLTAAPTPPSRSDTRDVFNERASAWVTWLCNTFIPEMNAGQGGGAWTQIATLSPNGVSTATFSSIPTTYSDLMIEIDAISIATGGSLVAPTLALSADGVTFTSALQIGSTSVSYEYGVFSGSILLPGYRRKAGVGMAGVAGAYSSVGSAFYDSAYNTAELLTWAFATGISAVRIGWSSTNTFDAGTIRLYGR